MKHLPILFVIILTLLINSEIKAQKYSTAGGLRAGRSGIGLTVQHRIMPKNTIEGLAMIALARKEFSLTALFEHHRPLVFFKSLNYYGGGGMHIGRKDTTTFTGFDMIFGIEYKIPIFRMLLSFDVKPAFHLNHPDNTFQFHTGFSVRYVFVTHRELKKRKKRKEREKKKAEKAKRKASGEKKGIFDIFKKNKDKK